MTMAIHSQKDYTPSDMQKSVLHFPGHPTVWNYMKLNNQGSQGELSVDCFDIDATSVLRWRPRSQQWWNNFCCSSQVAEGHSWRIWTTEDAVIWSKWCFHQGRPPPSLHHQHAGSLILLLFPFFWHPFSYSSSLFYLILLWSCFLPLKSHLL